ncbi:MAG: endolytic transglycosylase MltG [Mesorhizobium amorphae]|nr:MAG: endolytic transglycosylase MltG [Mesorhizobium amorphae]
MTDTPPGDGAFGRRAAAPPAAEDLPPAAQPDGVSHTDAPAPGTPARDALRPQAPASTPTPAPVARRRSRQSRNQFVVFLNFLISAIVLVMLGGIALAWFGKGAFEAPGSQTADATFMVQPNTGVTQISEQLERRGLISDARVFQLGTRLSGASGSLKAGEYAIPAGASMRDIVEILRSGRSITYTLTVPEGLTVEQALARVATHEALSGDMPPERPPEGSLAADTIPFTRGTPRRQIVEKLRTDQEKLVDEIWARRAPDLPIADKNEFVTLASIVEKETGRGDERPRVAAVFVNRLNKNMRLQSDPTIIYGLFGGQGKPSDRPIYQSDIEKPTPYNTYVINGLPPGPIANPGRAALEAVANPIETDDLYFVADGSGGHAFAATLAEHNRNVAQWRALERERASVAQPTTQQ